jgi:hypothetical protein
MEISSKCGLEQQRVGNFFTWNIQNKESPIQRKKTKTDMQISIIRENDSEGGNSVSCSFPQDVRVVDVLSTLKMAEISIHDMLKEKGLPEGMEVKEWLENLKIEDLYVD